LFERRRRRARVDAMATDSTGGAGTQLFQDVLLAAIEEASTSWFGGGKTATVAPGVYRSGPFDKLGKQHMLLKGLEDLTVDCTGVELVCQKTTRALTLTGCRGVTLRGLTIDYDPRPFLQAEVVEVAKDGGSWVMQLMDGFADEGLEVSTTGKVEVFDPETRYFACDTHYRSTVSLCGEKRYRVQKPTKDNLIQVGDIVVFEASTGGNQIPHAVVVEKCESCVLEDVVVHASNCMAFLETQGNSNTYRRCRAEPRLGLLRSSNADAFHSTNSVVGPRFEECVARYQGDDCVNVHGTYQLVLGPAEGSTLRVLAYKEHVDYLKSGTATLSSLDGRSERLVVTDVQEGGELSKGERQKVNDLEIQGTPKTRLLNGKVVQVTLESPPTVSDGCFGDLLAGAIGDGFSVEGCDFGPNRSRGILIKASGVVKGNKLKRCRMSGILVANGREWMEAHSACQLVVQDNVIEECGFIDRAPQAWRFPGMQISAAKARHRDISVMGNAVRGCSLPAIALHAIDGGVFQGNVIEASAGKVTANLLKKIGLASGADIVMSSGCTNMEGCPEETCRPAETTRDVSPRAEVSKKAGFRDSLATCMCGVSRSPSRGST